MKNEQSPNPPALASRIRGLPFVDVARQQRRFSSDSRVNNADVVVWDPSRAGTQAGSLTELPNRPRRSPVALTFTIVGRAMLQAARGKATRKILENTDITALAATSV